MLAACVVKRLSDRGPSSVRRRSCGKSCSSGGRTRPRPAQATYRLLATTASSSQTAKAPRSFCRIGTSNLTPEEPSGHHCTTGIVQWVPILDRTANLRYTRFVTLRQPAQARVPAIAFRSSRATAGPLRCQAWLLRFHVFVSGDTR